MSIERIVQSLNFDDIDDDMFAEVFTKAQIVKDFTYDSAILTPLETLPIDYLWYLQNYGSRTVRNMEFQVSLRDDTQYIVSFEGLVEPQKACLQYRYQTCTGAYQYRLEELSNNDTILASRYLPISAENQGKMLVIDLNDKRGGLWLFPSKTDCEKYELKYEPNFVANNLSEFLAQLKPTYYFKDALQIKGYKETDTASNVWKKNISTAKEIFYRVLANYENKITPKYTGFKDENDFLKTLLEQPKNITINEARAVELFYLSNNWKISNEDNLTESIKKVRNLKADLTGNRENAKISKLVQLTNAPYYIGTEHAFYKTVLLSTINDLQCKETFVLFKNENTQRLSFVKRIKIEKDELILVGIGVFEFDTSWSSKKGILTKWSEIPATIYLAQNEGNFTEKYLSFVKNTIDDSTLKVELEEFLFNYYQKNDYPNFLAMSAEDKECFEDAYPKVNSPSEIWKLLGEQFDVFFIDSKTMHLQFHYAPDEEHGLSISVEEKNLQVI